MRKQRISVAAVGFVLSMSLVVLVLVGGEGSRRGEVTVSGETPVPYGFLAADPEREGPAWLQDYSLHVPLIGIPLPASLRATRSAGILAVDAGSEAALHGHRAGVGLV